jgi:hypothetical protein
MIGGDFISNEISGLKNFNKIVDLTRDSNIEDASKELDRLEKEGKLNSKIIEFGRTMIKSRENARDEKKNPN